MANKRIVLGINSLTECQYPSYSNHIQMTYRFGRSYANYDFVLVNPSRMSIDRMRNLAAKTALEVEAEFLLFVDDDVLVPHDGLCKLLDACKEGADVAAGKAVIRGYPFDWMVFTKLDEETGKGLETYKELPKEGVIEVGATGFCFTLIRTELFKKMRPPFFLTALNHTEDIWFYRKALEANPGAKFVVDCSVDCGHILWPEVMNSENREQYRKYMEECNPDLKPENMVGYMEGRKQRDHALDYADKVKEAVGSLGVSE